VNSIFLWKNNPFKKLSFGLKNKGGRNSFGRLCSFKKGGHQKKLYRILDFKRNILDIAATVCRIEYDPNRSSYIALICYKNGYLSYISMVDGLKLGSQIINYSSLINIKQFILGNSFFLKDIANGTIISNIELIPSKGAVFCRSAGCFAVCLGKYHLNTKTYVLVRFISGIEYLLDINCRAVIGCVSNISHRLLNFKKAGTSRRKGKRPTVRGVAMNPIDHPHGGGEGKKSPKVAARTPWGKLTKGTSTRNKSKFSNKFILRKKIKGKYV
jgi:large subunit ribosomal protein L2